MLIRRAELEGGDIADVRIGGRVIAAIGEQTRSALARIATC